MWDDRPAPREALADHQVNPEYGVHLGQVTADGRRRASFWLQGQRWSGWLEPAEPELPTADAAAKEVERLNTFAGLVARRLCGQLAYRRITQKHLGELTGWSSMYISRRCAGTTALSVADLETIEAVTGISPAVLMADPA